MGEGSLASNIDTKGYERSDDLSGLNLFTVPAKCDAYRFKYSTHISDAVAA